MYVQDILYYGVFADLETLSDSCLNECMFMDFLYYGVFANLETLSDSTVLLYIIIIYIYIYI
jgi:hypothetical protein